MHGISMFLGCFFIGIIVYSMIAGAKFLRIYNNNVRYYNTYLSPKIVKERNVSLTQREKRRYYDSPSRLAANYFWSLLESPHEVGSSISLLLQSLLALVIERLAKVLHHEVSKIQFKVNTYGDSSFWFNVDGDGIFAGIFQLVLGAFNIRTKFCGVSDTKNCEGPFIENGWKTWLLLFCLAIGYFFIGVIRQKATYIMCRVCDFINPEQVTHSTNRHNNTVQHHFQSWASFIGVNIFKISGTTYCRMAEWLALQTSKLLHSSSFLAYFKLYFWRN